jgi:ATPase subunit of ABC transporter with duplicated ATPase domains
MADHRLARARALPALSLSDITLRFDDRVLFEGVSLHLGPGWCAVVGANGVGKTSFARLLAGRLQPTSGRVHRVPPLLSVGLVDQELDAPPEGLDEVTGSGAARLRARLGLARSSLARWSSLSVGERRRWQLGVALSSRPDVLILDEPESHLDADGRAVLLEALRSFDGIGVLVTHRRDLAAELCSRTLVIEGGQLFDYAVGPSRDAEGGSALEAHRLTRLRAELARRDARHERDRAAAIFAAQRTEHGAADARRSARARMRSSKDRDARSAAQTGRVERATSSLGGALAAARSRLARAEERLASTGITREVGRPVVLRSASDRRARVATLLSDELRAGDKVVLRGVSAVLEAGDKVHLAGSNGSGKSTLLQELARACAAPCFFLPQQLEPEARRTAALGLQRLDRAARGRVLSLVAALGTEPSQLLATSCPSPGEAKKLLLAEALARETAVLLLDEPENDLDLPSVLRLQDALAQFGGALVLVTHDLELAETVTTTRWELQSGRIV